MSQTSTHYNRVARILHWTIAALVISNILIGIFHDPLGKIFGGTMGIHKSFGLTVLALTIVRIGWRLTHPVPPLPAGLPRWERAAAKGTHHLFYVLMLALPLTGWIMSSAGPYPLNWFWLFDVPKFPVTREDGIVAFSGGTHGPLGLLFGVLALLHIGAALRHHFVLKDDVLRRMLRAR